MRRFKFTTEESKRMKLLVNFMAPRRNSSVAVKLALLEEDDFYGTTPTTKPDWIPDAAVREGDYHLNGDCYICLYGRWWIIGSTENHWQTPAYPSEKEWAALNSIPYKWLSPWGKYIIHYWERVKRHREIMINTRLWTSRKK